MKLPGRLLLVSLVFLVLPWAGCQYLQEVETALRQGQVRSLMATAGMTASVLEARLPAVAEIPRPATAHDLYAYRLENPPTLDGFGDDWGLPPGALIPLDDRRAIRHAAGLHGNFVYLFIEVDAPAVQHAEPGIAGDRLMVAAGWDEAVIAVAAPGPFRLTRPLRITGAWTDTTRGFQVELRLPLTATRDRLGFRVIRNDGKQAATYEGLPGRLVHPRPALAEELAGLAQAGARLSVVNSTGWRLAATPSTGDDAVRDTPPGGLVGWIYRVAVGDGPPSAPRPVREPGRLTGAEVESALAGEPGQAWYGSDVEGRALLSVAVPVSSDGQIVGAVVAEQDTRAILTLRDQALSRLLGLTLGASLAAGAVLLGFALWLSLRIRRLAAATRGGDTGGGVLPETLPGTGDRDELGDLARRFEALIARVGEHNRYLETLGQKLTHELRTPIAVVRSSLDNLEAGASPEDAAGYVARARQGADRLAALVQALGAATRIEEALSVRENQSVNLARLITELATAYSGAHPGHRFAAAVTDDREAMVTGSPDLLAQMVDKLVDNAVDFTAPGEVIVLGLERAGKQARLSVSNPGEPIPDRLKERLFERMASDRPADGGGTTHLGLGLYIARTIARHHGGDIMASNTPDGVCFSIDLPLCEDPDRD